MCIRDRAWWECLESGGSPWMGHDPAPRVEWAGEVVRVWSDGSIGVAPDAFAIELGRGRLVAELGRVERELRAFLLLVERWAQTIGFPDSLPLCRKLDTCFQIAEPVIPKQDA